MAGDFALLALFYGHIISAMLWLGGGILLTFVIGPNVRTLTPAAGTEFMAKVMPKVIRFFLAAIGSTFLFGILLFFYIGANFASSLYVGIALALVIAAVVFSLTVPSFNKVIKISQERIASGAQGPPPPEMMKFSKRARTGSLIGVALLLVVLALMIVSAIGITY